MKQITKDEFKEIAKDSVKEMVKDAPFEVGMAIVITSAKLVAKLTNELFDDEEILEIIKE